MADNSTQKLIEIENIKDGIIFLKSGRLRRILAVGGMNFDLKSEEDKDFILYSFQNFINSLDFPIQIFIHSRKVNIEPYLQELELRKQQETNQLLKIQMEEYLEFIRSFIREQPIMRKSFFVVVPFDPIVIPKVGKNLFGLFKKRAKSPEISAEMQQQHILQLNQRVEQVRIGLENTGLRAIPLNNQQTIELIYNLYNPESFEKEELEIAK